MLLEGPEAGEGICDTVLQALQFTKQHILLVGCRADLMTSQRTITLLSQKQNLLSQATQKKKFFFW